MGFLQTITPRNPYISIFPGVGGRMTAVETTQQWRQAKFGRNKADSAVFCDKPTELTIKIYAEMAT